MEKGGGYEGFVFAWMFCCLEVISSFSLGLDGGNHPSIRSVANLLSILEGGRSLNVDFWSLYPGADRWLIRDDGNK